MTNFRLRQHYEKILKLKSSKYKQLSDQEFLNMYQFGSDINQLLTDTSFSLINGEQCDGFLTGIFRTKQNTYYRIKQSDAEFFLIKDDFFETFTYVEERVVLQDLHQQYVQLKEYDVKEKTILTIFLSLLCIALILFFVFKQPSETLIHFESGYAKTFTESNDVYEKVADSVVLIEVYSLEDELAASSASGMIISEDGFVLSCAHIYDDIPNAKFKIILADGTMFSAIFVEGDLEADVCLLKITNPDRKLKPVEFADSNNIKNGDACVIVGFPGGIGATPMITEGIISSTKVEQTNNAGYSNSCIQTDAVANPGNSGGGLFNMKGQVIGIVTSKYVAAHYEGTAYSISSREIKQVINSLYYKGYLARPTLGISIRDTTFPEMEKGLPFGSVIATVDPSSEAYDKLQIGDVILSVNGVNLTKSIGILDIIKNLDENNLLVTMDVYSVENKEVYTIEFTASLRFSQSGYVITEKEASVE